MFLGNKGTFAHIDYLIFNLYFFHHFNFKCFVIWFIVKKLYNFSRIRFAKNRI